MCRRRQWLSDATAQVAREFARVESRVLACDARRTGNCPRTLNAGIEACRGRYVARMDADDVMHRDVSQRQVKSSRIARSSPRWGATCGCFRRRALTDGMRAYERWLNCDRLAGAGPRRGLRRVPDRAPDPDDPPRACWRASAIAIAAGRRTTISSCACSPAGTSSASCRGGCSAGATARRGFREPRHSTAPSASPPARPRFCARRSCAHTRDTCSGATATPARCWSRALSAHGRTRPTSSSSIPGGSASASPARG